MSFRSPASVDPPSDISCKDGRSIVLSNQFIHILSMTAVENWDRTSSPNSIDLRLGRSIRNIILKDFYLESPVNLSKSYMRKN